MIPTSGPLKVALKAEKDRYAQENKDLAETILATVRGTAVTRLAIAGATVPEIAAITGHSMKEVGSILDAHYMHRDPALSEAAIRKLEGKTISPNQTPDCPGDLVLNLGEML